MIFRTLAGLIIMLIVCSCFQKAGNSGQQIENDSNENPQSKSGLRIENDPNRGLNYTDTLGIKYSYRYIPITITNDSTIAIHIQMALSGEYDYPAAYGDQKFKVFLLPKELTPDKATYDTLNYEIADNEIRGFFDRGLNTHYILDEALAPGEICEITIGTLYPRPTNCGVVPNVLFLQNKRTLHQECDSLINQNLFIDSQFSLGLKIDFNRGNPNESCTIIPCGQISYLEH